MAYEHLISKTPIQKTLNYGGKSETVYFRRLTAGERLHLKRGQKGRMEDGKASFDIEWSEMDARSHLLLSYANVDSEGKQVFKGASDVARLEGDLVDALVILCNEALKEEATGN